MAAVKKSKKSAQKPSTVRRRPEEAQSLEEFTELAATARAEHYLEEEDLGNRLVNVIEKAGYHPSVTLDVLHSMLSVGIGVVLGAKHKKLWDAYTARFHAESKLLTLLERFDKATEAKEPAVPETKE